MESTTFTVDRKKFNNELFSIKKLTPRFFKAGIAQINVLSEQIELYTTAWNEPKSSIDKDQLKGQLYDNI